MRDRDKKKADPRVLWKHARYIRRFGRSVVCVFPTVDGPDSDLPFSYTIGNQAKGLPELLVIGSGRGTYLNEMSERMIKRGCAFDHGEIIDTGPGKGGEKYRVKIINASDAVREHYTIQAGVFYETHNYRVQQVGLSDLQGHFPGEEGCDPVVVAMTNNNLDGFI